LLTSSLSPTWFGSIPSPSFNTIAIGPLSFTLYGLMIGLGIIAATIITRPRAAARGLHPDTPVEILIWIIPAGVVGARLYHVLTDWVPISDWAKVWEGGLGIPGGILAGVAGGLLFVRRRNLTRSKVLDALIVGVPLAQAIGRWGNWWNQELYGRATDVAWAVEIDVPQTFDADGRVLTTGIETYHPTFLYESLWNLALVGFLIWIDRRRILKPGRLIWVYTAGYAIGRLWIEALRIDKATEIFGVRVNLWTMGITLVVSLAILSQSFGGDGTSNRPHDDDDAEERATSDSPKRAVLGTSDEEE
jgi:prolipoprotein diacylglyceryl transferase